MHTVVIVNPHSANRATGKRWPDIRRALEPVLGPFDEHFTNCPDDATELTRRALQNGAERVIAVGGDGTNNEVVNGFFDGLTPLNPRAVLGFIPRGTGGDLRKTLGIGMELDRCLEILRAGRTRPVDVGSASFIGHDGGQTRRLFINITSFGMGGLVDKLVNQSTKALGGKASFLIGTMKAMARYRNQQVALKVVDGDRTVLDQTLRITNVAVANGQYHGGGMWVAPNAVIDDGLFDVTILGNMTKTEMMRNSGRIYKGTHLALSKVSTARGTHVEATGEEEVLIDMDGEQPGRLPINLDILPGSLTVIAP